MANDYNTKPDMTVSREDGKIKVKFTLTYHRCYEDGSKRSSEEETLERNYTYYGELTDEEVEWAVRHTLMSEALSLMSDAQEAMSRDDTANAYTWINIAKRMMGYELRRPYERGETEEGRAGAHKYTAYCGTLIC